MDDVVRIVDDDSSDVVRICEESTCKGNDGDRKSTKMEKGCYQESAEDRDLLLIYLLERGN